MDTIEAAGEQDDRELVEASRRGDSVAFETLVRRKTSKVYSVCYRVLGNAEDARDVAQLVFVRLWESLDRYDPNFGFDTWLYRMAMNLAIDTLRSRQSREAAVNSNLRLVRTVHEPEQTTTLQHKEIEAVFNDVSSVLSEKQKAIFVLREMEDISSAEISRMLGCRESTVRNHLFNARKLMQEQLKKKYPEYASLWRNS